MLKCEMDSLPVLILSGSVVCVCVCVCVRACVCVRVYSRKQWLLPIQPKVMRQSKTPAGCNEAPCSSTLPHQVSLCLSAQQACVCTAPRLATKPHMHKHTHTHTHTHTDNLTLHLFKMFIVFLFLFPTSVSYALMASSFCFAFCLLS